MPRIHVLSVIAAIFGSSQIGDNWGKQDVLLILCRNAILCCVIIDLFWCHALHPDALAVGILTHKPSDFVSWLHVTRKQTRYLLQRQTMIQMLEKCGCVQAFGGLPRLWTH